MSHTEQQIKTDILNYMKGRGGKYADWYVGVSKDARDRLLNGHGVDEKKDAWIYRQATSSAAARRVEKYFCEELGTDGAAGGGDETADMVYAYKKSARTRP